MKGTKSQDRPSHKSRVIHKTKWRITMKKTRVGMLLLSVVLLSSLFSAAQQSVAAAANATVPPLIPFASVATDDGGNSLSGVVNITFSLYAAQQGGAPLWTETQNNIQLDSTGHYSVQLGVTQPNGVPATLFTTGEARWLGVRLAEQAEEPRALLLSVPYALKAGDAATIGGLPPSAFVLAATGMGPASTTFVASSSASDTQAGMPTATDVTGAGTVNFIPLWTSTSNIANSVLFQSAASPFKIGINTTTPATTLDVKGAGTIRGVLALPATAAATAAKGAVSQPLDLVASAFNSTSSTAVNQTFQWQAEPAANDTTSPSGTLNLLFGTGATKPAETGLHIANNGQITFATGQTFPGTGGGTITGVTTASTSGLTGGGTSGTLNLALTSACAKNQVLQWNGTAWACAAAGTGTVTSVASGAGLTGGPITGSGTLSIAANSCSSGSALSALPFTCSPFATLGANTFTGIQTINSGVNITSGSLSATLGVAGGNAILGTETATTGTSIGVLGNSSSTSGYGVAGSGPAIGVEGESSSASGFAAGVFGQSASTSGYGVYGFDGAQTGSTIGVLGQTASTGGIGVEGASAFAGVLGLPGPSLISTRGAPYGTVGASSNVGVYGASSGISATGGTVDEASGVWGDYGGTFGIGVLGTADDNWAAAFINASNATTIYASNLTTTDGGEVFHASMPNLLGDFTAAIIGDPGCAEGSGNMALQLGQSVMSGCSNYTLLGNNVGDTYLNASSGETVHLRIANSDQLTVTTGTVNVNGTFTAGDKKFKIDHPLDPANKYLYHTSVESSEMMNIYTGNVTTDASGLATVQLPDWFEALNTDFRYQLTAIGQFAQAIVASEISQNEFSVRTDKPNVKVSWQVTGVRHDAFAKANRIPVEVEKASADRGHYLYPEAIGQPATARIGYEAPPPGSEQIVHHRPALQRRSTASPTVERMPLSIPVPPPNLPRPILPRPVVPQPRRVAPQPNPAALAGKPGVDQQ
jgi:hypothetical protein